MNRNVFILSVSFLSLLASEAMSGLSTTYSCESLGYTVPYDECVAINGTPLICPFYALDEKMTMCISQSCRGYDLTEEDLNVKASDSTKDTPKTIRDHIKELEACCTGIDLTEDGDCDDENEVGTTYYRVKECKEGSLYTTSKNNNICEVGCLAARYPFKQHPGDLAGSVDVCTDASGTWYGYADCNDGWTGGWNSTKHDPENATGRCDFASCDVKDYPYSRDPNSKYSENDVNRGATSICKIGANNYYRYTAVDKNGAQLKENVCGLGEHSDYTLSMGVCRKQCVFEDCQLKDGKATEETLEGYTFSYNEFICTQATKDCRVGDMAVFENVEAGIIVHLPENSSDRLLIMHTQAQSGKWADGIYANTLLPLQEKSITYGKTSSKWILRYKSVNGEGYLFPIFENAEVLTPLGCENIDVCNAGEWYIPTTEEYFKIYDYKYIVAGTLARENDRNIIYNEDVASSSMYTKYGMYYTAFSFSQTTSPTPTANKISEKSYFPVMSIYVR